MLIRFWGVRGSLPAPLRPGGVKERIAAILERALPDDLATTESREHFLAGLPPWLYGTVGGNTPCVGITIEGFNEPIIFDCGSGLRELALACAGITPKPLRYHIFLSHFHWDHLSGFPFFNPAYDPSVRLDFYSPTHDLKDALFGQMKAPYFPIEMQNIAAEKHFHFLDNPVSLGSASVSFRKMNHPGDAYSYQIRQNGKRFIYSTDTELITADFLQNEENTSYFQNADMIVLDSQYTMGEAIEKYNWGHSAFSMAVDFAAAWNIKHLVLFHHDPAYDDRKLHGILQSARWYINRLGIRGMEVSLAAEDTEIVL